MRTTPPFRRQSCRVAEAAFDRGVAVAESPTSPRREDHWFHTQGAPPVASGRFRSEEWHLLRHPCLRDLVRHHRRRRRRRPRRRRRHRPPAGTPGISAGNRPNSSSTRRSRIGRWRWIAVRRPATRTAMPACRFPCISWSRSTTFGIPSPCDYRRRRLRRSYRRCRRRCPRRCHTVVSIANYGRSSTTCPPRSRARGGAAAASSRDRALRSCFVLFSCF